MKHFFQFVAFALLLNLVSVRVGEFFNLTHEPAGSPRLIIALIIWWTLVIAGLFFWLVVSKRRE